MINIVKKIFGYFQASYQELKLVVWPKRSVVVRSTILVIVFSVVIAAFLGLMDYGFSNGLAKVLAMVN